MEKINQVFDNVNIVAWTQREGSWGFPTLRSCHNVFFAKICFLNDSATSLTMCGYCVKLDVRMMGGGKACRRW